MFHLFNEEIEDAIKKHAGEEYPKESCGLVIGDKYIRCSNVHDNPTQSFELSLADQKLLITEDVKCIIHSHPDECFAPSGHDMETQSRCGIPFGICESTEHGGGRIAYFGDSLPIEPFEGRPFIHGITDCYTMIRDYYRQERGIIIPEFPRSWDWWRDGKDLYQDGFEVAGFQKIDASEAKEGDVILCQIQSKTPNHGAIFIDENTVLHHIGSAEPIRFDRVSKYDSIKIVTRYMTHVLRYVGK